MAKEIYDSYEVCRNCGQKCRHINKETSVDLDVQCTNCGYRTYNHVDDAKHNRYSESNNR